MPQNNKCILIGDDDIQTRILLKGIFEKLGLQTREIANRRDFGEAVDNSDSDLLLLNVNFSGLNGTAAMEFVRTNERMLNVTMSDICDRKIHIDALEAGADDHFFKPLDVNEVSARTRALLRRYYNLKNGSEIEKLGSQPCKNTVRFDNWIVNPERYEVTSLSGEICSLTTGDFKLLMLFLKNAHRVLSRDDIMDALHGHDWSPFDRSIDNQISRLRRKIEQDPARPTIIKTVRGAGYALISDVEKL